MFAAVIPAQNENIRIKQVIQNLLKLPLNFIIPVINGCHDNTLGVCLSLKSPKMYTLHSPISLGIDVPRAVGAHFAHTLGATGVLFIDGDMNGNLTQPLNLLITAIKSGTDCALTNCYPYIYSRHPLTKKVLKYREILNRKIGLFHQLGLATPSHGPHAVSRRLLDTIPIPSLAVPPVEIAYAKMAGLKIDVAAAVSHHQLGSRDKSLFHTKMVAHTIIGDCLEALALLNGTTRHRRDGGVTYDGYNPLRRFDLLEKFLNNEYQIQVFH
ncbi:MAG: glycosyltransferase family 2 protein [Bacillota bacterium]|nr:glycosyltransferase [Clostridia bacterium]